MSDAAILFRSHLGALQDPSRTPRESLLPADVAREWASRWDDVCRGLLALPAAPVGAGGARLPHAARGQHLAFRNVWLTPRADDHIDGARAARARARA